MEISLKKYTESRERSENLAIIFMIIIGISCFILGSYFGNMLALRYGMTLPGIIP